MYPAKKAERQYFRMYVPHFRNTLECTKIEGRDADVNGNEMGNGPVQRSFRVISAWLSLLIRSKGGEETHGIVDGRIVRRSLLHGSDHYGEAAPGRFSEGALQSNWLTGTGNETKWELETENNLCCEAKE